MMKSCCSLVALVTLLTPMMFAQTQPVVVPIPYIPGASVGPFAPIADPSFDADQLAYAQSYWQVADAGTCNPGTGGLPPFVPLSPTWVSATGANGALIDIDPFGDGLVLFERIFEHRLQLDPNQGPLVNITDLIDGDFWVRQQWRHWTLTHQLVTADFMDPIAHLNHVQALIESLSVGVDWQTRGVPYFDQALSFVISDRTKKKKGNPAPAPVPVPLGGLPQAVQNCDAHIRGLAGVLSGFPGLYDADGSWCYGHKGFDCDDFADAIGSRIIKGQAGMTACTVRVVWTLPNCGGTAAHRVTKFSCGGYYWIVDAQTGAVSGPHLNGAPVDARPVLGGYNVDNTKPVQTIDDCRTLGQRGGWAEPPAWFNCPAQRARFQNLTGLDPTCFF